MSYSKYALLLLSFVILTGSSAAQEKPAAKPTSEAAAKPTSEAAAKPASEPSTEKAGELKVETVVDGLTDPFALAIQPQTGHVFVSDSGAMRVVRIVGDKIEPVITGFAKSSFGPAEPVEVGPMGLAFLDKDTLIVAGGRDEKGHIQFAVYKVPAAGKESIAADKHESVHSLQPTDDTKPDPGIGFSMLATAAGVYATTTVEPGKGWLLRADRVQKKVADFKRFVSTTEKTSVGMPIAIARDGEAGYMTVGEIGTVDTAGDSLLAFYDEKGELLGKFTTGLNDISGLAYGPKRRRLFATDYNALDSENGGLYKLIAEGSDGCRAVKLAGLAKPTAIAFDSKGNLFITVRGKKADGDAPTGQLLKIGGLDSPPKKPKA